MPPEGSKTPKPPLQPTPGHTSTLTGIRNKPAPLWQPARTPAMCSQCPRAPAGPGKLCLGKKKYTSFQVGGGSLKRQRKTAWFCLLTAFLMFTFSGEVSETQDCDFNNYYYLKIPIKTGNLRHQSCEVFMQRLFFYNGANFKYSFYLKHCTLHFQSSACKVQCQLPFPVYTLHAQVSRMPSYLHKRCFCRH